MKFKLTSPPFVLAFGISEVILMMLLYNLLGLGGRFFSWGPPVTFFSSTIETQRDFYVTLIIFGLNQLLYSWVYEVLQPWIYTEIQNNMCKNIQYSKWQSIMLVNLYYTYLAFTNVLVVQAAIAQISFLLVNLIATWTVSTYINLRFIARKEKNSVIDPDIV